MRRKPRFGIVGARRARQGLGPFVAKWLAREGAEVVAHAGTTADSVAAAARDLVNIAGVSSRGYVGVAELLAAEDLDAVAILSPPEHHAEALALCQAAGLHVLCEKPLLAPHITAPAAAAAFEGDFRAKGLLLWENCQWPRTLPSFRALHPEARAVPERFAMGMEPASHGRVMASDALSHPLSLLQALVGAALTVDGIAVQLATETDIQVTFDARGALGAVQAAVALHHNAVQPRRAWYRLDGLSAERTLRLADYTMQLSAEGRAVDLPDPLQAHLAHFVGVLAGHVAPGPEGAVAAACGARAAALQALVDACG